MLRYIQASFVGVVVCGIVLLSGCSNSSQNEATPAATGNGATAPAPNVEAITQAAADFVDAVVKGDTQRANARLSPQALKRTVEGGTPFNPPGWENTTFQIGEVRTPEVDKALVRCVLICNTPGDAHNEEMYCLLRYVDNDWRVSGIAYRNEKFPNGNLWDFETGRNIPVPGGVSSPNTAGPANQAPQGVQTLPPRMAQDPAGTAPR